MCLDQSEIMGFNETPKEEHSVACAMHEVQAKGHHMLSKILQICDILPWFSQYQMFYMPSQGLEAKSSVTGSTYFILFLVKCLLLAFTLRTTEFQKWGTGRHIGRLFPQGKGVELHTACMMHARCLPHLCLKTSCKGDLVSEKPVPMLHCVCNQIFC